jgi:hypothetical protein
MMNWKGCGKKWPWPNLRNNPSICVDELRKTKKNSWSLDRDLNSIPLDHSVQCEKVVYYDDDTDLTVNVCIEQSPFSRVRQCGHSDTAVYVFQTCAAMLEGD